MRTLSPCPGVCPRRRKCPGQRLARQRQPEIFPGMGEHLAVAMRHASLTVFPGEGHLLLFTHWAVILRQLAARQLETQERQ